MSVYYPKVSIIIPAYNASNYLEEAINSALKQTYHNTEIIVINDGSNDNGKTAEIAKKYKPRIKYFEKENGGSSSALNYGISEMTGEWFSWLSHDDLYMPEKVEKQIELLRSINSTTEQLWNHVVFTASELIDSKGRIIRASSYSRENGKNEAINSLQDNAMLVAGQMKYFNFHGCGCLVNKKVFDKVGIFDENLRLLNDVDMWYRIYINNFRIHYIPVSLVKGRIHAKQISRSIEFSYHNMEQDMFWQRSFIWLTSYSKQNVSYKELLLFMRVAYEKTRYNEGKQAYNEIVKLEPSIKYKLMIEKIYYITRSKLRNTAKVIYLKLFLMNKGR